MLRFLARGTLSIVIAILAGPIPTPGAQPEKKCDGGPGTGARGNPDRQGRVYLQRRCGLQSRRRGRLQRRR